MGTFTNYRARSVEIGERPHFPFLEFPEDVYQKAVLHAPNRGPKMGTVTNFAKAREEIGERPHLRL
jgi:hypothetical protein